SYSCIKLSLEILQQVFQHGPWMARHICEWSKNWIATKTLPVSQQGYRKYTPALIDNENIQNSCLRFIRTIGEKITAKKFQDYVYKNVLPHVTSSRTLISLEIARKWFCHLGLSRLGDGWFINAQGERVTQSMIFSKDLPPDDPNYIFCDEPKGIRKILRECNLWPTDGLRLKCGNNYYEPSTPDCCTHHL
ncbi:6599_t:CDS:2, partial [Dentiscutata heterogama]